MTPSPAAPDDADAGLRQYRRDRVQQQMRSRQVPALLLMSPLNLRYAIGANISTAYNLHAPFRSLLLPAARPGVVFDWGGGSSHRFDGGTVAQVRDAPLCTYFPSGPLWRERAREFAADIRALLDEWGAERRVAIDTAPLVLIEALEQAGVRWSPAEELMHHARSIKSRAEIACIEQSMSIAEAAMQRLKENLRAGLTERELWSILAAANAAAGGDLDRLSAAALGLAHHPMGRGRHGPAGGRGRARGVRRRHDGAVGLQGRHVAHAHLPARPADGAAAAPVSARPRAARTQPRAGASRGRVSRRGACVLADSGRIPAASLSDDDSRRRADERVAVDSLTIWTGTAKAATARSRSTWCSSVESIVAPDEGGEGVKLEDMVVVEKGGFRRLSLFPFEASLLAIAATAVRLRLCRVDLAPVEIGGQHPGLMQVERVDREDVAVEHDEISALARLQAAGRVLLS